MYRLTSSEEDLCSYTGLFGILISLTCVIQHMIFGKSHLATFLLITLFLLCAFAFTMLALKKRIAPPLLIVSCVLALSAELIHLLYIVFSVIVIILFIYCVTITVVIYMADMPAKLSRLAMEKKAEEDQWMGKL